MTEKIRCIRCGKVVATTDPQQPAPEPNWAAMVRMRNDGQLWTERNAPALSEQSDMGWHEVGSDCYRQIDAAGTDGMRKRDWD